MAVHVYIYTYVYTVYEPKSGQARQNIDFRIILTECYLGVEH